MGRCFQTGRRLNPRRKRSAAILWNPSGDFERKLKGRSGAPALGSAPAGGGYAAVAVSKALGTPNLRFRGVSAKSVMWLYSWPATLNRHSSFPFRFLTGTFWPAFLRFHPMLQFRTIVAHCSAEACPRWPISGQAPIGKLGRRDAHDRGGFFWLEAGRHSRPPPGCPYARLKRSTPSAHSS